MKKLLLIAMLLITLVALSSCAAPASNNDKEQQQKEFTVGDDINLSKLEKGKFYTIKGLEADSIIKLDGFTLEDGVYIEPVGTKSLNAKKVESNPNMYEMQSGKFLAIPDYRGSIEFSSGDLRLHDGYIKVWKFDQADDLTIAEGEHTDRQIAEEFYYIDLSNPRWSHLDKSNIAVVKVNPVGQSDFTVISMTSTEYDQNAILDMSEEAGFGIYHYSASKNRPYKLEVVSPIDITAITSIKAGTHVIYVPETTGKHQITLIFNGGREVSDYLNQTAFNYLSRRKDGTRIGGSAVTPYFYPDQTKVVLDLQNNSDFYFNLRLTADVTVSYETSTIEENRKLFSEFDTAPVTYNKEDFTQNYLTIPFTINKKTNLEILASNDIWGLIHQEGLRGYGDNSIANGRNINWNYHEGEEDSGFMVVKCSNDTAAPAPFLTIQKHTFVDISCSKTVWDPTERTYVCTCSEHSSAPVKTAEKIMVQDADEFFSGTYQTAKSYGKYGIISIQNGIIRAQEVTLNTGSRGNGSSTSGAFAFLGYPNADKESYVKFELKRIVVNAGVKTFYGELVCNGVGTYQDVAFIKQP